MAITHARNTGDNNEETPREGVTRRTVTKGIAWSMPVVATAIATPLAAASTNPPDCGCLDTASLGAFTAQAVTLLGLGTVTGTIVYNLNSSACNTGFFQPAYTVLGVGGTIFFNDNTSNDFSLGVTTGVGTIGSISAFTSPFTVIGGVNMPDGGSVLNPVYPQKVPTRLCMTFTAIFVPLPIFGLPNVECTYQLCYDITNPSSIGFVTGGTGTVNWSDLTPSNPVMTP